MDFSEANVLLDAEREKSLDFLISSIECIK
jgi:hypothetical protein